MVRIALVGLGYWGPNLARNITVLPDAELYSICDLRQDRLDHLARQYPHAQSVRDYEQVLANPNVDALVLSTPVATHYPMARAALLAGKHVMVEKPLAQRGVECQDLIFLAKQRRLILMAAHVFVYNAAVSKVREFIQSGEMGELYYIYSQRLNLGVIRRDVNALWNFAPHDISILYYWLGRAPERVTARGYSYIQPGIEDVVFMTLDFPGGVGANVHISWLDPHKVRRMTVVGSKKMVVYDDVSPDAKIMVFDKGVTKRANQDGWPGRYESFGEFQLMLRAGDVLIPRLDFVEPLKVECAHFVNCIRTGRQPLTDGAEGMVVVQTLEAAQRSLDSGGLPQEVASEDCHE